jgi:hypothetical protein
MVPQSGRREAGDLARVVGEWVCLGFRILGWHGTGTKVRAADRRCHRVVEEEQEIRLGIEGEWFEGSGSEELGRKYEPRIEDTKEILLAS